MMEHSDTESVRQHINDHRQRAEMARAPSGKAQAVKSESDNVSQFFKSLGGRYKHIRKRCHGKPNSEVYAHQYWCVQDLERLSEQGLIDLFYGDESRVSSEGYVPYGWQFPGEDVAIAVRKGYALNIFGLISRSNLCHWTSTESIINGQFLVEYLDRFCLSLTKLTFLVLNNASGCIGQKRFGSVCVPSKHEDCSSSFFRPILRT